MLRDDNLQIAELTAVHAWLGEQIAEAKKGTIRDGMIAHHQASGGKTVDIEHPELGKLGTVTISRSADKVEVTNRTALAAWLEVKHPGSTEWVLQIKDGFLTEYLKTLTKDGADYATGQVVDPSLAKDNDGVAPRVPGVTAFKGGDYGNVSVSVSTAAKPRVVQSVLGRPLKAIGAAPEAPAAEDAGVVEGEVLSAKTSTFAFPVSWPTDEQLAPKTGLARAGLLTAAKECGVDLPTGWSLDTARKLIRAKRDEELAPGVTRLEATEAAVHAITVQGGFSTPEIEAERIAKDRARAPRQSEASNAAGERLLRMAADMAGEKVSA
jgi:hypothetical protein